VATTAPSFRLAAGVDGRPLVDEDGYQVPLDPPGVVEARLAASEPKSLGISVERLVVAGALPPPSWAGAPWHAYALIVAVCVGYAGGAFDRYADTVDEMHAWFEHLEHGVWPTGMEEVIRRREWIRWRVRSTADHVVVSVLKSPPGFLAERFGPVYTRAREALGIQTDAIPNAKSEEVLDDAFADWACGVDVGTDAYVDALTFRHWWTSASLLPEEEMPKGPTHLPEARAAQWGAMPPARQLTTREGINRRRTVLALLRAYDLCPPTQRRKSSRQRGRPAVDH